MEIKRNLLEVNWFKGSFSLNINFKSILIVFDKIELESKYLLN